MSEPASEDEVVTALREARSGRRTLTGFPGPIPADMAAAYRIQDAAIAGWPDTLVGWKIGFIPADRRAAGEPDRLVGPIWARQCRVAGDDGGPVEMEIFARGFAAVEAELVVRLEQDLPDPPAGGWTAATAAAVEHQLLLGLEVASSPIPDINALGPTVIAADFGNNNGLVIGPSLAAGDPGEIRLACRIDGQPVGEGSGANLPGGLYDGLATAWNLLTARGHEIRAGMVFATGATTGIHPIGPGQHARVQTADGAAVEVRTRGVLRDYQAWHRAYEDPDSGLSWRLRTVQGWLHRALDERTGPVRVLSVCAGEGRDILGVLAERADADRVAVTLVERDPRIVATARQRAAELGLNQVEVRAADAGDTRAYAGLPPADIVLLVGIFGNVSPADIQRTITWSRQQCAPGATVVWSRGRDRDDRNAEVRGWFAEAGFVELDYAALDRDRHPALGLVRYEGGPVEQPIEGRVFTFYR